MANNPKGHWPQGKRRHPCPPDWPRLRAALDEAFSRRQGHLVARDIGVHRDTIFRWRRGVDLPEPRHVRPMIDALYALKLYFVRAGRKTT